MGRETEVLANILEVDVEQRRRRIHMLSLQSDPRRDRDMADRAEADVRRELAAKPTAARREHLEALLPQVQVEAEGSAKEDK